MSRARPQRRRHDHWPLDKSTRCLYKSHHQRRRRQIGSCKINFLSSWRVERQTLRSLRARQAAPTPGQPATPPAATALAKPVPSLCVAPLDAPVRRAHSRASPHIQRQRAQFPPPSVRRPLTQLGAHHDVNIDRHLIGRVVRHRRGQSSASLAMLLVPRRHWLIRHRSAALWHRRALATPKSAAATTPYQRHNSRLGLRKWPCQRQLGPSDTVCPL